MIYLYIVVIPYKINSKPIIIPINLFDSFGINNKTAPTNAITIEDTIDIVNILLNLSSMVSLTILPILSHPNNIIIIIFL